MTTVAPPSPASPPAAKRKPKSRHTERQGRLAAMLVSPTFVVLGLVVAYPLLSALRVSLYQRSEELDASGFVVQGEKFVGVDNYSAIFEGATADRFWNAAFNTTFFTVTTVALEIVIGVSMALVMHHALRGRGLVRATVLVPWAVPTAVSALLWKWMFQADGVVNAMMNTEILWTSEGIQAKLAVIIADVWKTAPFVGLLVLAGLQIIPTEIYEASKVDGASPWRQFWRITLPLVRPALLVAVLFRVLDALRMFDLPYVMVGARKYSVETLSMLAFEDARNLNYGPAAAYATLLFVYVVIIALIFVKILGADVLGEARQRFREVPKAPKAQRAATAPATGAVAS